MQSSQQRKNWKTSMETNIDTQVNAIVAALQQITDMHNVVTNELAKQQAFINAAQAAIAAVKQ